MEKTDAEAEALAQGRTAGQEAAAALAGSQSQCLASQSALVAKGNGLWRGFSDVFASFPGPPTDYSKGT